MLLNSGEIEVHPAFDSPSLQRLKKRPVLERENSLDVHASKMAKTLFPGTSLPLSL